MLIRKRNISGFIIVLWYFGTATFLVMGCASTKHPPSTRGLDAEVGETIVLSPTSRHTDNASLIQNEQGLWELYVSGNPLQRGVAIGALTHDLLEKQEAAFVDVIRDFVPSPRKQRRLRQFLRFFNRELEAHVDEEYRLELFGVSKASSPAFDFIAPPYHRILYFHGAHDIGHALRDLALVGCSSFAAWGSQTQDGKLLVGRNFDFHVSDTFSEDKIIYFIAPDRGHKHALVSWAGMLGAMSGMNEYGLTVTINAGKSNIPWKSKTPISLVAREILQYAANIEQAVAIAERREVFVAESIMVASAADQRAAIIEVSPKKMDVYEVPNRGDLLVCTNHFQSEAYQADKRNLRHIQESHTQYRFDRLHELIDERPKLTPQWAVDILRNRKGLNNAALGYGNEKAINQLMAHHAVVFQPEDRLMWVSTNPYQLGSFVAYDLNTVFAAMDTPALKTFGVDSLRIKPDPFMYTQAFQDYQAFRQETARIKQKKTYLSDDTIAEYIALNPEFWYSYKTVADRLYGQKEYSRAAAYYQQALEKEVSAHTDRKLLNKRLRQSQRRSK